VYNDRNSPNPKIVITAYGEEYMLSKSEKRRTWTNITDSEIVRRIAAEYGWSADITDTTVLHEHVAQVNESDWKFIDRRARYYGFMFYVENGVLHFHEPRYVDTGIMLSYFGKPFNQLNGFTAWEVPLQHGKVIQADQIDPLSKELFTVTSQEVDDKVSVGTKAAYKGPVVLSQEMSSLGSDQPIAYMLEEGHKQTRFSLGKEVEGFSQFTRWMVVGEGNVVGLQGLKVNQVVELIGLGRDSGEYFISSLATRIKSGQSLSNFRVTRTWRGASKGSLVSPKTVTLREAS
jgi:hypothetical protein